jgi:hypothetical protein
MENADLYINGHLIVAAIRLLQYQRKTPSTIEDVCQLLTFSLEQGNLVCKKLIEMKIIESVKSPFGLRLTIRDHLVLEDIPKTESSDTLAVELEAFQAAKKDHDQKIAAVQAKQSQKQKDLFSEIEKQLKTGLKKNK